ncbi:hypothetical protein [Kineosporia sp. NBRC 101731]|uniref:hypothetical protein n=1 Tax=Kineosporia sp. NBRC 101731 TaxID=3032199 RepID=UPI0024A19A14|nr:hypothetical protein [Kineosporia sp. NBRC 101731]GLY30017.1 hypothetical protein Kisp02_33820 [Kineosporia sp. NBRC 101731]
MHTLYLEWQAIWKILGVGLILGAGLPALFALGIRAMAYGTGGDAEQHPAGALPAPHPAGRALAYLIFALVLLAVALGILVIVASGFGKEVSFGSVYPTLHDK